MDWLSQRARLMFEAVGTFFGETLGGYFDRLPGRLSGWWEEHIEAATQAALDRLADHLEREGVDKRVGDEIRELGRDYPYPIDTLLALFTHVWAKLSGLSAWVGAIANVEAQQANADIRPNLVGLEAIGRYALQHPEDFAQVQGIMRLWGLPDAQQTIFLQALRVLPSLTQLLTLVNRDIVTEVDAANTLTRQGFTRDDAFDLLALRAYWPSPTDIVSLAGREAFEEDAIQQFNLDADMPEAMFEAGAKAGVSREVLRWYWVAHWQNPSLTQVFEMIHRGVKKPDGRPFSQDDLDTYYRLADVNPFFGDMLRQIAFRPYTRVDIRRMYDVGVLDRDQVKRAYLDLGYDDDHAENITEFVVRQVDHRERDLTRSQVEQLYRLGLIDGLELRDYYQLLGYDAEESYWLKDLLESELAEQRTKAALRRIEYDYKRQLADRTQTQVALNQIGITAEASEARIAEWENERVVEEALPSRETVTEWFAGGIIDEQNYRARMRRLRYTDDDIDVYIRSQGARLSKTDVLRLFTEELITYQEALSDLLELGYDYRARTLLLSDAQRTIARREEFERLQESGE